MDRGKKVLKADGSIYRKTDEWCNPHDNMGTKKDPKTHTIFKHGRMIHEDELNSIYATGGLGSLIIDLVVDDSTASWIKIKNDTEDLVLNAINNLRTEESVNQSFKWARLFGGSIIIMLINDGSEDLEEPLNEQKIKSVFGLRVFDSTQCIISTNEDFYGDPMHPKYNEPEIYTVTPRYGIGSRSDFRVHESRVLRFDGHIIPDAMKDYYENWGVSEIQRIYDELKNTGDIQSNVVDIIRQYVINIMKIKNYLNIIESGKKESFYNRMNLLDMSRRMNNTFCCDDRESIERVSTNASGLADLIDRYLENLCAVSKYPFSVLMQRPPKGLGSGGMGENELKRYYQRVEREQKKKLYQPLKRLAYLIQISKEGPTKGKEIKNWDVIFNPLQVKTDKEMLENQDKKADIDKKYWEMDVLSSEEIRESRYGGENYSIDTKIKSGEVDNHNKES